MSFSEERVARHVKFLRRCLDFMPAPAASADNGRLVLLHFIVCSLDLLGKVDDTLNEEKRKSLIDWVLNLQVKSRSKGNSPPIAGFRGSPFFGKPFSSRLVRCYSP